jgi:tRNA(Arg) A34 adenosine deaminase TadA
MDYEGAKLASTSIIDNAIIEAKKSNMSQKHGCVIVSKNKIIARGFNTSYMDYSVHAEQDAVNKLKGKISKADIKNCKLYVIRIGKVSMDFPLKYSKPCPRCTRCIINAGVKTVYYSTNFEIDNVTLCHFV